MMLRLIYSLLYVVLLLVILPFQYFKRPKEIRKQWLKERLGSYSSVKTSSSKIIWVHAVSVGEVIAAIPFLNKLKEQFPEYQIVLSTVTDTGQKVAKEKSPENTKIIYLPFDLASIIKKTIKNIRPSLFITMETELWPNLFYIFKKNKIPIIITNGRISDKSYKGYLKIKFFIEQTIKCVDLFGMQDSIYAQRITELGAPKEKVKILGNFKFDTKPSKNIPAWTGLISSPVVIAGSTHKGEEELVLSAYEKLRKNYPDLNLILAPRHPERFREAEELTGNKGLPYIKRTAFNNKNQSSKIKGAVIILDAVGELAAVYSIADIAVIGGSFIKHGGQNLLEPACWSKPIICGTHMENFPFAKEFYEQNAAIEASESNLYEKLSELLGSPEKRNAFGRKAKELYDEKSGAVEKALAEIRKFL